MKNILPAELLIYCNNGLFEYNVAYVRDGGQANYDWESYGIFPSVHDALVEGKQWLEDAKLAGYKRGARSVPRIWTNAA